MKLPEGVHARISVSEITGNPSDKGYVDIVGKDGRRLLMKAGGQIVTFPPHTYRVYLDPGWFLSMPPKGFRFHLSHALDKPRLKPLPPPASPDPP